MVEGKVTGANVSVRITDDFMESVAEGTDFVQKYPVDSDAPMVSKSVDAKALWNKIIHNAWKSAEPGVLFLGYHYQRVGARLLFRPRFPYNLD